MGLSFPQLPEILNMGKETKINGLISYLLY